MLHFIPSKYVVRVYITSRLSSESDRNNNYTRLANTVADRLNGELVTKDDDRQLVASAVRKVLPGILGNLDMLYTWLITHDDYICL